MKIYGISGLGADSSVFQYLNLDYEFIPIDWIKPFSNEPIEKYAIRLFKSIDTAEPFIVLGVSFGGLVATEISKIYSPFTTVLISSAETKYELRWVCRIIGKTGIIKFLPNRLFDLPRVFAHWLFGANNKKILTAILDDTDLSFTKWALNELTNWKNKAVVNNCIKINGTADKLIPPMDFDNSILIKDGGHFMVVDRATEISEVINREIKALI